MRCRRCASTPITARLASPSTRREGRTASSARSTSRSSREDGCGAASSKPTPTSAAGARPRGAAAHAGARPVRGRCGEQHRSRSGAGGGRAGQRAIDQRQVRIRPGERGADPRHRHHGGSPEAASRRHSLMARARLLVAAAVVVSIGVAVWYWLTRGRESTDDAQIDSHLTQVSARVAGTIVKVAVDDNQTVDAGALLVELDPRDYQVAVDRARAELADAEAAAQAAQTNVPITSTTASSNLTTARGGVAQAQSGVVAAEHEVAAARARLTAAQAKLREAEANATKAARDVERLRGLLAKD